MESHWRHDSVLIVKDLFANPGLALGGILWGQAEEQKLTVGLGRFCPDTAMGPQANHFPGFSFFFFSGFSFLYFYLKSKNLESGGHPHFHNSK